MRPAEVSTTDILAAGKRLLDDGKTVNGWSLRRALGDRGKPERLATEWKKAQDEGVAEPAPQAAPTPVVLPPVIAESADQARLELTAKLDGIIFQIFRTTDEALKTRYKSDFDRLTAERAQMEEDLGAASASVDATENRLTDALNEADSFRAKLAIEEKSGAVLAERFRALEAKSKDDTAQAEGQIRDLEDQVRQFGAAAQNAQKAQAAAEATAAAAERDADRLRQEIETLKAERDAAKDQANEAKTEIAVQRARADRAEADLVRVRQERDAAAERAGAAELRATQAEARAAAAEHLASQIQEEAGDDPKAT